MVVFFFKKINLMTSGMGSDRMGGERGENMFFLKRRKINKVEPREWFKNITKNKS
jgi:hypothetical protein